MNADFLPINGTEHQLEGFAIRIHDEDTIEEKKEEAVRQLQRCFRGETAHKIIRVKYQRGQKSFIVSAGFDESLYNDVVDWIEEVYQREYKPLVFEFMNFVSYNPPQQV